MNYCHACRRHLNGALACAGCGTPAEYLPAAPPAAAVPPMPEAPTASTTPTALADVYADSLVTLSAPNERRAGARRRSARRKRSRTTLTVALGVVIAGAASLLAVNVLGDGERSDRASTVVLTDDGPQQPAPLPDLPTSGAPTGPSGKATAKVAAGPTKKSGTGAPSGGAAQPAPVSSAPAPVTSASPSATSRVGGSAKPTVSGTPTQSPTGNQQSLIPPPPPPSPPPAPPEDCGFLGWKCW
ncbi:hypothetical protein OG625_26580 [Streptomyces sp. NBC_01351]|uniref:SCO2400 family protein n=1 Tax=Streptomyces sp. NBC_01351 TaxID=2903833 RepID=UPI002E36C4C5|nr:hypothetical protein [Streptomyces sp. NBC_01351]